MMKAIKNFMNKPVTWGDSFKWSGIVLGLYAAVIGACVAYEKWTDYKAEKEMLKKMLFVYGGLNGYCLAWRRLYDRGNYIGADGLSCIARHTFKPVFVTYMDFFMESYTKRKN